MGASEIRKIVCLPRRSSLPFVSLQLVVLFTLSTSQVSHVCFPFPNFVRKCDMPLRMRPRLLPSSRRHVTFCSSVHQHATILKPLPVFLSGRSFSTRHRVSTPKLLGQIDFYVGLPFTLFRHYSTSPGPPVLQDPIRPSIYYHLIEAPNPISRELPAYAVSLLEKLPANPRSPTVMGWLLAASTRDDQEAGIQDFLENNEFLNVVHEVLRSVIAQNRDERLESEAIQLGSGWMHINDDRNLPEVGRISRPDDIIASVRVEDGKMLPETYNPMPTYRICTTDGLTTLSPGLEEELIAKLRQL